MNKDSIDAAVDGFIVTVAKGSQRDANKFFYAGTESEVAEHVNKTFPESVYFARVQPARKLSPGVYCLTQ